MSARTIEAVSRVRYPVPFSAAWYPPAVLAGVVEGRLTMHITLLSRVIVFAAAYLILCGCQMAAKEGVPDRYWSTGIEQWVSPQVLSKDARDANYVLLGEIHDNPIHHDAQGELILRLAGEGFVVGFEQLHLAQGEALEIALSSGDPLSELPSRLAWDRSGWPPWSLYEPVFSAALQLEQALIPLSFPSRKAFAVVSDGYSAVLPAEIIEGLGDALRFSPEALKSLEAELAEAHCGKLPATMLPGMATVQIARDAHMAWRQVEAGPKGILVVGGGHARRDRGVPRYLAQLQPEGRSVVVLFLEERPGVPFPQGYPEARASYADYLALTPAAERSDPCAQIERRPE